MTADSGPRTLLFFDERRETILPYSSDAFKVSTGPRERVLERYLGVIVLDRDGTIWRIDEIRFEHLWGESRWRRIFSFVNGGTRKISVTLRQAPEIRFNEMRQRAVDYITKRPELIEQYFDKTDPGQTVSQAARSSTASELFDALGAPAPLDCLDALIAGS
ncbi:MULTISPECIES: hypothetical protein [unclassified Bradyrhizobium]|uniref:hypothetical protein n=1 Tax=unclassified Bradyrhizobium TaxID=2631580 RepID=UPI0028E37CD4|nr:MULTISPECIES: hypothetical protein [unclassified Bradyrhizobium]